MYFCGYKNTVVAKNTVTIKFMSKLRPFIFLFLLQISVCSLCETLKLNSLKNKTVKAIIYLWIVFCFLFFCFLDPGFPQFVPHELVLIIVIFTSCETRVPYTIACYKKV